MTRIVVINPNSNKAFTDHMDGAVDPLRANGAVQIDCVTLEGTPFGIETQRDVDSVIDPVCTYIEKEAATCSAFVIACFADTGVLSAREITDKPVVGICEAGITSALNRGERYGIVSTSTAGRNDELRLVRSLGLEQRLAGTAAINIPVADILTAPQTYYRMLDAARVLRDAGADVLVLGCAGMTPYREKLQLDIGLPIIDPTVAATAVAIGLSAHT
ncbi:MAG: aspartate/glutamate racemase family protein [Rhodospirillales bacterium]|nr:aspartate/glutamate racemase family protein [Rhodospirillales bacterium]